MGCFLHLFFQHAQSRLAHSLFQQFSHHVSRHFFRPAFRPALEQPAVALLLLLQVEISALLKTEIDDLVLRQLPHLFLAPLQSLSLKLLPWIQSVFQKRPVVLDSHHHEVDSNMFPEQVKKIGSAPDLLLALNEQQARILPEEMDP